MRYQDPQLQDLLAAEYVLGTLTGAARRRFEGLQQAHPALRRRVQDWNLKLNRLAPAASPVTPQRQNWQAIEQRLFGTESTPVTTDSWFQRLAFWRGLAFGSSVLAGLLAVVLLVQPVGSPPGYVAMINNASQNLWMVSASNDNRRLMVKNMQPMDLPAGMTCVLWLKPTGEDRVYALGMLPDQGDSRTITVSDEVMNRMPGRLLVTMEKNQGAMPEKPGSAPMYTGEWMPVSSI